MHDQIKLKVDFHTLPRFYHQTQKSDTRPLLFILGKQILKLCLSNQKLLYLGIYHLT